jgi:glycogen debranching enzyme
MLALEALRYQPQDRKLINWVAEFAARNLRTLAETQGTQVNDDIEEQPGKIIHEFWSEPPERLLAQGWPMQDGRYYGSVDATYLFLMAACMVWDQIPGGHEVIESLWNHVWAALRWTLDYGDVDGDGLVEVQPRQPSGMGLRNQVWKDSTDSLSSKDYTAPPPPIAWVELQGYAIAAYRGMATLLHARDHDRAVQEELMQRINRIEQGLEQFWLAEEGCPAMALTREKAPLPLVSSNIGHLLWCGALRGERAEATATRLMQPDMLTAWGIRTLSATSDIFDPNSYHRGSIWPFDSAIAAAGLWHMGHLDDAHVIARGVLTGLASFGTPVELYCVIPSTWIYAPDAHRRDILIKYRHASATQAWSAAASLLCVALLLAKANT